MAETVAPGLERRLKAELAGEVMFDRFTRGRYATDASHYQMMPVGVVTPRTIDEANRAIAIARTEGVSVTPRGGGTSPRPGRRSIPPSSSTARNTSTAFSRSMRRAAAVWSNPASCWTSSTASLSRTASGFRLISPRRRAPPSAAWSATIPAAPARCAMAIRARTMLDPIDAGAVADGSAAHFPDR